MPKPRFSRFDLTATNRGKPWDRPAYKNQVPLRGTNRYTTRLGNTAYTQESGEALKIEKNGKTAFHEKNKDKTGHAISLPDAIKMTNNTLPPKTLLTHINTHLICFPHQVWSHSAHKRPKNYQKTYFLPLRGHAKTPKYSHEWVHQIAHCTRTTGPIDYLSIWKVALPPK